MWIHGEDGSHQASRIFELALYLLGLGSRFGLGPEVGRGGAASEEATEDGLEEGVEDDLGTAVRRHGVSEINLEAGGLRRRLLTWSGAETSRGPGRA